MSDLKCQSVSKEGIHKEIFICRCRKQYESFPALYLHNKTKHSIVIHTKDKEKMRKKSVWSGNKKKMIYEFSSQSEIDSLGEIKRKQKKLQSRGEDLKSRNLKIQTQEESLRTALNQFMQSNLGAEVPPEMVTDVKILCSKLVTYICNKNIQMLAQEPEQAQIKKGGKIQIFPYFLNPFALQQIPSIKLKSMNHIQILQCLEQISNWMFDKKHCSYLAVLRPEKSSD